MNRRTSSLVGTLLAVVLFFAVNIVANASLRSARMDLTEDQVFTLDDGSRSVARGIDEPINLYFYFSRKASRDYPQITEYAERVLGMLREYERASDGKILLSVIDPEPFSEAEEVAVQRGLRGAQPELGKDPIYFGLAGSNATDERETIPFFALDEAKQRTLEYDLSKLIWTLANPDKSKVGILTALDLEGGGGNPMMGMQGAPRWKILDQLEQFFDVTVLSKTDAEWPADLDALVVVHPRGFGPETHYKIDQWALAGKPLVVFVDPQCDVDPGETDPTNPMSRFTASRASEMPKLFQAWGFEMAAGKVAGDRARGLRLPAEDRKRPGRAVEIPWVYIMGLTDEDLAREDPVTRLLDNVLVPTPGSLRPLPEATTTFTPLMQTSEESHELEASEFQIQPDPQAILERFVPDYARLTLAARVTGNVSTAFPDGQPGVEPPEDMVSTPSPGHLTTSTAPLNLIVFADADLLHERTWMRELRLFGGDPLPVFTSQNVDLVKNAIESVCGGEELMSIRSRSRTSRPFERVQEMQRDADQRFLAEQKRLQDNLQRAETRLRELESAQGEGSELVSVAQREEKEKLRLEIVQTNKNLRDVQHKLRKDVERLGTNLKWFNIALMPLLVSAAAVLGAWKTRQRTRK
jgi:ABC-type uncharacterized transport system involved in gliding motility auxiliary subunit